VLLQLSDVHTQPAFPGRSSYSLHAPAGVAVTAPTTRVRAPPWGDVVCFNKKTCAAARSIKGAPAQSWVGPAAPLPAVGGGGSAARVMSPDALPRCLLPAMLLVLLLVLLLPSRHWPHAATNSDATRSAWNRCTNHGG